MGVEVLLVAAEQSLREERWECVALTEIVDLRSSVAELYSLRGRGRR